ncbi:hypothetical protein K505DRAFT_342889 [Melanomma pulvis-pyrius CBS 109.77]|uniref:Uncharacterized protein n=1 Tax=Melanomma pulvis-pyrius CBS 109.77 TaxID=1314802 RepID=A0A6A6WTT5_9PLEO|nr:hypothetical protein K505DRAFT_342889 [Melanomma pulvis-pyrius CBS 109.77]
MADPFSITGGAVGIVSLTITTCAGVVSYIGDVKDAKEKVQQFSDEMDQLTDQLSKLDIVLGQLHPSPCRTGVEEKMAECVTKIERLKKKLYPACQASAPGGRGGFKFRQQLKETKQRLWFPFTKESMLHAKTMVDSIRQDLQTALSMLIVDLLRQAEEKADGQHVDLMAKLEEVCSLSKSQSKLIQDELKTLNASCLDKSQEQKASLKDGFQGIHASLDTLQKQNASLKDEFQGEGKFDKGNLQSDAPAAIQTETSLRTSSPKLERCNALSLGKRNAVAPCVCRPHSQRTVYLEWLMPLVGIHTCVHEVYCPRAVHQNEVTDFNLQFSFCSPALQRRIQIGFDVWQGLGLFRIKPSLTTYRIVHRNSPAFRMIHNFSCETWVCPQQNSWVETAQKLWSLFRTRQASPFERLDNGQTLLHYLCSTKVDPLQFCLGSPPTVNSAQLCWDLPPNALSEENFHQMVRWLLDCMTVGAIELDSMGYTCADYLVSNGVMPKLALNALLDHGISISTMATSDIRSNNVQLMQPFIIQNPDSFKCPGIMKAIFLQSEDDLKNAILRNTITQNIEEINTAIRGYSPIEVATLLGWKRGCEILLDNGAEIKRRTSTALPLLCCASLSSNIDVLRYWIDLGPELDEEEVLCVGRLEEALESAYEVGKARGTFELLEAVISEIKERKNQLQMIAEVNAKTISPLQNLDMRLNAHALRVYDALVDSGVEVPPYLKPAKEDIYAFPCNTFGPKIGLLNALYAAEFRIITPTNSSSAIDDNDKIPLLLIHLTAYRGKGTRSATRNGKHRSNNGLKQGLRLYRWLIAHGADTKARWPGSQTTALHCLAYNVGRYISSERGCTKYSSEILSTIVETCTDDCECGCSAAGCLPITTFFKSTIPLFMVVNPVYHLLSMRPYTHRVTSFEERLLDSLRDINSWTNGTAAKSLMKNRLVASALIRFATFTNLGLRHTCCDISRIQCRQDMKPDACASPHRYNMEERRRIMENDAFLLNLLEELVQELEAKFEALGMDLAKFMFRVWRRKMRDVLDKLEREGFGLYDRGRRELDGVKRR